MFPALLTKIAWYVAHIRFRVARMCLIINYRVPVKDCNIFQMYGVCVCHCVRVSVSGSGHGVLLWHEPGSVLHTGGAGSGAIHRGTRGRTAHWLKTLQPVIKASSMGEWLKRGIVCLKKADIIVLMGGGGPG